MRRHDLGRYLITPAEFERAEELEILRQHILAQRMAEDTAISSGLSLDAIDELRKNTDHNLALPVKPIETCPLCTTYGTGKICPECTRSGIEEANKWRANQPESKDEGAV
ncbi:hypothetical protein LCGC14_2136310 [marine sediment metagenome]|uniref:Uncharacterized protein n=1 Tax=marine sediment metagenome TaxID=412755 RepID=A0A0F9DZZ2_9ZZZZ